MNLNLRKCGNLYVKFDDENNPLYAFEVVGKTIKKFHPMCDDLPETIILPKLKINISDFSTQIDNFKMLYYNRIYQTNNNPNSNQSIINYYMELYGTGAYKLATECFKGIKKSKIIVPVDYSIMIDWNCFDDDAEIELVLPNDMTLKQVYRTFDTGFDYEHENWTLISHKDFNFKSKNTVGINVLDYQPECSYCKFNISNENFDESKSSGNIKSKKNDKRYLRQLINPELMNCKAHNQYQLEPEFDKDI